MLCPSGVERRSRPETTVRYVPEFDTGLVKITSLAALQFAIAPSEHYCVMSG
jgi:hypothetical protein